MRYSFPQVVFGFHGCDRSVGEAVLAGEICLESSKNSYDWLGSGIYFWESSPQRALQWAQECVQHPERTRGSISDPYVIGAIINLGNCLNLTSPEDQKVLKDAHELLLEALKADGLPAPENTDMKRALDCSVINATIHLQKRHHYEPFDTVRGAFEEGVPIYPGARFNSMTHIQICVRNSQCICGYFLPTGIN